MKKFIKPELEVVKFSAEDIMTVSGDGINVVAVGGGDDSYKLSISKTDLEWNNQ